MTSRTGRVGGRRFIETNAWFRWLAVVVVFAVTTGSGAPARRGRSGGGRSSGRAVAETGVEAATVSTRVTVPVSMSYSPFNVDRYLNLPQGFSISVYARVGGARFMAVAPNGDLLVSQPGAGKVVLVRPNPAGDPTTHDFATGLRKPHDMVFHTIGSTEYLSISESTQIDRFIYNEDDTAAHDRQVLL